MPDLLVHSVVGYLVLLRERRKFLAPSIFLLGCIFPDLIRGPLLIGANLQESLNIRLVTPEDIVTFQIFHSPIPLLVQAWLFCFLFERDIRFKVFFSFSLGVALHLFLDAGQRAYHISYLWMFPFSIENPIPGIWWSDESSWITIIAGLTAAMLVYWKCLKTPKSADPM
jgi:membrane-bound metal-dependent hydrolase YbcI (DUF457 family)|tara:strand:- start:418 stop:924 length:507 start_codon:yes stop_codon:yes gene_type:complete